MRIFLLSFLIILFPFFLNGQVTYRLVSEAADFADSNEPLDWQPSYGTLVVDNNKQTFTFYQDEVTTFYVIKSISKETTSSLATMYSFDCVGGIYKWRIMLRLPFNTSAELSTLRIINLETFDSLYYELKQI
jgi:hypothetical protein